MLHLVDESVNVHTIHMSLSGLRLEHCHHCCNDINPSELYSPTVGALVDLGIFVIEQIRTSQVLGDHLYEWTGGILGFLSKDTFVVCYHFLYLMGAYLVFMFVTNEVASQMNSVGPDPST
jgi:hypothetical protein